MRMSKLMFGALLALAVAFPVLADKTHVVNGTVVAVDTTKNTITLKGSDGKESTGPVEGAAQKMLASLKAGDKVKATCRDNDKGEHQALTAIAKG